MAAFPDILDDNWRRAVRKKLLQWYDRHGRSLPWREAADPYRIWISEIMLQQTTIAAVTPYFERFTRQFPDVQTLADADEQQVLRAWEGLGYYSRARNLHKAAGVIAGALGGRFPETVDELRALPGIGPYTARAIASFAFAQPVGILEANTLRLFSRLIELSDDPRASAGNRLLWEFADWVVSPRSASAFNQAAMDLGSTVCTPVEPDCGECCLRAHCRAASADRQHEIPLAAKKPTMTSVTEVAIVITRRGRYLMRQAETGERWAGLWDFVRFPVDSKTADALIRSLNQSADRRRPLFSEPVPAVIMHELQTRTGLVASELHLREQIHHTVTRYRIRLLCVETADVEGNVCGNAGYRWVTRNDIGRLPLSTTARQIARNAIHKSKRRS